MGTFRYGASQLELHIDDVTLVHLQTVITTKLRRNEGLLMTWQDGSRGAAWIHPHCDLSYRYDATDDLPLDNELLDRMMAEASGTRGLRVPLHEPGAG